MMASHTFSPEEKASSVSLIISNIKNNVDFMIDYEPRETAVHNLLTGYDDSRNIIYMYAKVEKDSLDLGFDPSNSDAENVLNYGVPGDLPCQFVGPHLGGDGFPKNIFPVNPEVDLTEWKNDQNTVYSHVKNDENCSAYLIFGVKYEHETEPLRPSKLFYHFELFKDGKAVGKAIERKLLNPL